MNVLALIRAMRPHQWVKNVFVLAALLFALGEVDTELAAQWERIARVLLATASFCLGASAIYLLNDVMDVESDRMHPTKRERPIAAGLVSVPLALGASALCVVAALALGHAATPPTGTSVAVVVLAYMVQNFGYSLGLKRVAILDAFLIAFGFLLRVLAGGLAAAAPVSHWLMLCTFFLALFLAFCKRRAEMDLLGHGAGDHRHNLRDYTTGFLDQAAAVLAACAILTYSMYTVAEETLQRYSGGELLVWTVPFVVFGLFRYLLLVQRSEGGGNPTQMLLGGDALFVTNALLYVASLFVVLFHGRL